MVVSLNSRLESNKEEERRRREGLRPPAQPRAHPAPAIWGANPPPRGATPPSRGRAGATGCRQDQARLGARLPRFADGAAGGDVAVADGHGARGNDAVARGPRRAGTHAGSLHPAARWARLGARRGGARWGHNLDAFALQPSNGRRRRRASSLPEHLTDCDARLADSDARRPGGFSCRQPSAVR